MTSYSGAPPERRRRCEPHLWYEQHVDDLGAVQARVVTNRPLGRRLGRTPLGRPRPRGLTLTMPLRGRIALSQDRRPAVLDAGDFVIHDAIRPCRVRAIGPFDLVQALVLQFPRVVLPVPGARLERVLAVPVRSGPGLGELTSRFLRQLAGNLDEVRPAQAVRLATATLDLVAARLAHVSAVDGSAVPGARQRELLTPIHAFVEENLGDPRLSPSAVATAHHISLRYLHKLFRDQGATVAAWIRERRLEGCRRSLGDPALAASPVAAIAARHGFTSAAHFSQAFKAAYGMPPGRYRSWILGSVAGCRPDP